ncbi:TetR/AcrR family transcriptional regulator [Mycobacterium sp. 663a-19]|uniref:TetR/AcrR family transcriptional regulator n=1 Tax=Mycobacterium sp. 663a-19 TaxID=2986148 RepID=UPI002D1EAFD3|nr:TetR/AcrR family transcriptional regulator [Mycobacterium sp. 663a-19]MEB3980765.1 TetR/AcrR family transcriptional regulator [Mycobacterium sp. 663a-19]
MSHSNKTPTRPEPRRQRLPRGSGGQLREQIIDTATELIIASGDIKAPSTREVTRALNISAPSLYRHFANKDELLDAVCAKYYRQLGEVMQDAIRDVSNALERLHILGMTYVRFAVATPLMYRVATGAPPRRGSNFDETLISSAFVHLRETVQELMDQKFFPPGDPVKPALQLWAAAHGVASLLIAKPYLPWGDAEAFTDSVLRAVCVGQAVDGLDLSGLLPRRL